MSKSTALDPFVSSSLLLEFVAGVDRRERTNATATKATNALTVRPILMNPSPMPKPMAAKMRSPKNTETISKIMASGTASTVAAGDGVRIKSTA